MSTNIFKLATLAFLGAGLMSCSQVDEAGDGITVDRPNPPYFPLAGNCKLPDLSPEMEKLQTKVMSELRGGILKDKIDSAVLEKGSYVDAVCGSGGSDLGGERVVLYLETRNLQQSMVNDGFCTKGMVYTALASTPSSNFIKPKVEVMCEAMTPRMVGSFGLKICTNDNNILDIKVIHRENSILQNTDMQNCL